MSLLGKSVAAYHVFISRMDQQEYGRICTYVTKKELPSGLSKNKKDALRRKCRNFVMKVGASLI